MRVTVLLRDEGYVSRKSRWDKSKTMTTRWFCGPVILGDPRCSVVFHCTDENSSVVMSPPVGAINNNSIVSRCRGQRATESSPNGASANTKARRR